MSTTYLGENLTVVLIANVGEDWQTFATWFSTQKQLPHANYILTYIRRKNQTPFQLFQWAKRLRIKTIGVSSRNLNPLTDHLACIIAGFNEYTTDKIFAIPSHCMMLQPLPNSIINIIEKRKEGLYLDEQYEIPAISTLDRKNLEEIYNLSLINGKSDLIKSAKICGDSKEENPYYLISCNKGCGKWIHTKRGCPFSSAGGLLEEIMTVNEIKIISLWEKMVCLYNSVN